MQFSLSAGGSPASTKEALQKQANGLTPASTKECARAVASAIGKHLDTVDSGTVSVSVSISVYEPQNSASTA